MGHVFVIIKPVRYSVLFIREEYPKQPISGLFIKPTQAIINFPVHPPSTSCLGTNQHNGYRTIPDEITEFTFDRFIGQGTDIVLDRLVDEYISFVRKKNLESGQLRVDQVCDSNLQILCAFSIPPNQSDLQHRPTRRVTEHNCADQSVESPDQRGILILWIPQVAHILFVVRTLLTH